ncbi:MAG: hypothetical protein U5K81_03070 [Trueperaceae bacterium]|nr:hypothetical protein [Trueperaceae bacterium]
MSHRTTNPGARRVQDGPGPVPADRAPTPRPAPLRVLVASVEPFALWAHRWGRLDAALELAPAAAPNTAPGTAASGPPVPDGTGPAPLACSEDGRTVAHADAAARAAGVREGMTLAGARQRLPALRVLPAAGPEVDAAWEAFLDGMHAVSPRVVAIRSGVVAFEGDAHDAAAFAERTGARVGGADTVEEAHLSSYLSPPGRTAILPRGEDPWDRLDAAPLYLLGGVGLSPAERARLAWLGVDTIGALRRWRPAQLRAFLGEDGRTLEPVLHGPRTDRVPPRRPPPVITAGHAFEEAAREPRELDPILARLVQRAADALGERSAERVRVTATAAGLHSDATRRAKQPLREERRLLGLARLALHDTQLVPLGVDAVQIELSGLAHRNQPGELWPQRRRRAEAARAVHARFPGQARRFVLHDPDALRPRLRWALRDAATDAPVPWPAPVPAPAPPRAPTPATAVPHARRAP